METSSQHFCEISREKIYFLRTKKIIPLHEIIMIQGDINYSLIYLKGGRKTLVPRTLKLFESLLENYNFLRTHRGFIINCDHLLRIDRLHEEAFLTNNLQASISRRRRAEVSKRLQLIA
ncbi:LytR/AlgR family response regulator transcription factor [Arcicella aurantiaca]|nr:LytTR family transcriptional regulator DNA-binding domain-containing protein [Arcicella aurantiaca]